MNEGRRKMWRAAYTCDCEGEEHSGFDRDGAVDGTWKRIERVTGVDARGVCPWRGFSDPAVVQVIRSVRAIGAEGSPALLLLDDPPNHIWEGVLLYREIRDRIIHQELEQQRKKKAQQNGGR